jgi:hypothetical protein
MSASFPGFVVVLDRDIGEERMEIIKSMLAQLRGVISVEPVQSNIEQQVAYERARIELGQKLIKVLNPDRRE